MSLNELVLTDEYKNEIATVSTIVKLHLNDDEIC
jgi:hypothetical protein